MSHCPTFNAQPSYGGGATSGDPGTAKTDKGHGNSSTTEGQTIFDIDAFSSTGFDKPGRANIEGVGGYYPSKVAYSNVPLTQIRTGNINMSNTSAMNDPFAPPPSQQQPPAISNSGGYPQEMQAFGGGGGYTAASLVQQSHQTSGMMGYAPPLQQGQLQQTPFPNQGKGQPQAYPSQGQPQAYPSQAQPQAYPSQAQPQSYPTQDQPQAYPSQGQPQAYPTQRQGMAPQYQQQPAQQQHYTMQPGMKQPLRQPQQQSLSHGGNTILMNPALPNYAGEGNPFGGNAAYMDPQSQLAPQGNRIQGGAYMANSQSEGYNTGTTSTPFHNANAVQLSRAGQARANEWDPFGPGPGSVATAGSVAAVAPTVGTTASRKWDPFLEEEQKATPNDGPSGGSGVNDTWADIQDSQIWEISNIPGKGSSDCNTIEEEAEWSDDDDELGAASDDDSRNKSKDSIKQEQADFEMALKLQREEEEKANNDSFHSTNCQSYEKGSSKSSSRADGEVLSRISRRTLMRKKWRHTYYVFDHPDVLLLYRSRDDFLYNPRGAMIKKQVEIKHNNTLTALKRKMYKEYGMLWHFTLEEMMDYGPSVIAKFASHERRIIEELGNRIADPIRDKRRVRARLNNGSYALGEIPRQGSNGGDSQDITGKPRESYDSSMSGHDRNVRNSSSSYTTRVSEDKYSKWGSLS